MKNTYDLLDKFRNKAGAWQSQQQAERLKIDLKQVLSDSEYNELCIAHGHYQLGEGTNELYSVCKELMSKHQNNKANT
ncbi:hypothetical protein GON26_01395 [Flavobacterium sp. GA093]|uniref:Uncharacterized protein n=1 Tax=Flavobacterium hydrocarbonoxydans TaxID=2683249 RepID=A0A6I4NP71_9FLAO|nr:hypothetical protein [Flavobacterium hydrocarbonoxydans]MWB93004.1 hypothetical protein [Flavobacterium hydrocarbonoxydans]